MPILTRDQLEKLAEVIRTHASWVVWKLLGDKYVSKEDMDRFSKLLPTETQIPAIKYSFVLGKMEALLKEAEWKGFTWDQILDSAKSKHTDLQKMQIEAAELSANVVLRGLFDDIQNGLFQELATSTGQAVTESVVKDKVAEEIKSGIESRKGYIKVANSLVGSLKEKQRDWHRVAVTEMQAAREKGVVSSILSGEGVYRRADGNKSLVAVVPDPDACFVPSTRILTNRGNIPISEVCVGDLVVTHKLRWRRVTNLFSRKYSGRVFGENEPVATGNHPYLVNLEWSSADSIKDTDQIISLRRARNPKDDPPTISQESFFLGIPSSGLSSKVPISSIKLYGDLQRRDSNIDVVGTDRHFWHRLKYPKAVTKKFGVFCHSSFVSLSGLCFFSLCFWGKSFLSSLSGVFCELLSLFFGHTKHSAAVCLTSGLKINPPLQQSLFDVPSGHSKVFGNCGKILGGLEVHLDDSGFVQFGSESRHSGILYATSRRVNNFVNGFYSGTVHNLEVEEDQSYFAEGVAVHNCQDCIRLYIDPKTGRPKIFELSELLANEGTNYARPWRQNAMPVVPPLHPNCYCRLRYVPPGWGWNDKGRFTVVDRDKYSDHLNSSIDKSVEILKKSDHSLLNESMQQIPTKEEVMAIEDPQEAMELAGRLEKLKELHSDDVDKYEEVTELWYTAIAVAAYLTHGQESADVPA
jgi:hypothetical protein